MHEKNKTGRKVSPKKRVTFYIREDLIEKIKAFAYWKRLGISDTVNIALDAFFKDTEIREIPKKHIFNDTGTKSQNSEYIKQ